MAAKRQYHIKIELFLIDLNLVKSQGSQVGSYIGEAVLHLIRLSFGEKQMFICPLLWGDRVFYYYQLYHPYNQKFPHIYFMCIFTYSFSFETPTLKKELLLLWVHWTSVSLGVILFRFSKDTKCKVIHFIGKRELRTQFVCHVYSRTHFRK